MSLLGDALLLIGVAFALTPLLMVVLTTIACLWMRLTDGQWPELWIGNHKVCRKPKE